MLPHTDPIYLLCIDSYIQEGPPVNAATAVMIPGRGSCVKLVGVVPSECPRVQYVSIVKESALGVLGGFMGNSDTLQRTWQVRFRNDGG